MRVVFLKKAMLLKVGIVVLVLVGALIYGRAMLSGGEEVFNEQEPEQNMLLTEGSQQTGSVALTFDTAFGQDETLQILDVLKQQNITATFAVMGAWANENSRLLRLIHADGHEIISHSMNHERYIDLTDEEILADAQAAQAAISGLAGVQTNLIRVPYGACDERINTVLQAGGFSVVGWSLDSMDWNEGEDVAANVTGQVAGGDIVLFQNNVAETVAALPSIIESINAQGLTFATVSQM